MRPNPFKEFVVIYTLSTAGSRLESDQSFTYTITRDDTSSASTLDWSVGLISQSQSNNRSASIEDFANEILPSGVVSFSAGQASAQFSLNINNDNIHEYGSEIFNVGIVGTTTSLEDSITDDDAVPSANLATSPFVTVNQSIQTHLLMGSNLAYKVHLVAGESYILSLTKLVGQNTTWASFSFTDPWNSTIDSYVSDNSVLNYTPQSTGDYNLYLTSRYNHGDYAFSVFTTDATNLNMAQSKLDNLGLSISMARDFLLQSLNTPQYIVDTCANFGINTAMLAGIVGVRVSDVNDFFSSNNIDYAGII